MIDVVPMLNLATHGDLLRMEVHVTSANPRPLQWTLKVNSRSPGGTSSVSQGGTTDGRSGQALASMAVNRTAAGEAVLVVRDGGQVVAEKACRFGEGATDAAVPPC